MTKTKRPPVPPTHEDDPILTLTEVAERLGKHRRTAGRWITEKMLPGVRMPSGIIGVRESHVNKLLQVIEHE